MRISHFFIDRPIFASVVSIVIVILGGVGFVRLPVAQYPEIAPPTITVHGQYPGASADVVAATVVTPIEQQINGVENMIYMTSNSTSDGNFQISVTFDIGTNLDIAQVQVQNRVSVALPRLPADVRNIGVTVNKSSPDIMMVVHLYSPDKSRDTLFMSNYATLEITDALSRIDGVGSIVVFGSRDYAMRIWLDPDRLQSVGLTASDVVTALQGQNVQVASGVLSQPPVDQPRAFQISVQTLGRLKDAAEFANIVVKQTADAVVRLKDVATVELAAQDYTTNSYLDRDPAIALGIFQRPGSNALATADNIKKTMENLSKRFPPGMKYTIVYNPTQFIAAVGRGGRDDHGRGDRAGRAGGHPVPADLARRRHPDRRHPGVADRHVLRDVAVRLLAQQSVAVRPGARHRHRRRRRHRRGGERRAQHRGRPEPARCRDQEHGRGRHRADRDRLVLCSVFIPSAFITGISGQFYRQFALTIAGATVFSLTVSLTLSPALCALLLKPHSERETRPLVERADPRFLPDHSTATFAALTRGYGWLSGRVVRVAVLMLVVYAVVIAFGLNEFRRTPVGFIPQVRPRLSHHRHATAAGGLAGAHRRRQPARRRHRVAGAGRRACGQHRRLLRRDLHPRAEFRRDLRHARSVRGARQASRPVRRAPSRANCSSGCPPSRMAWSWWSRRRRCPASAMPAASA